MRALLLLFPLVSTACLRAVEGDDTGSPLPPGPTGEELSVILAGSTTCGACDAQENGVEYQTPSSAVLGIRAIDLLRSDSDSEPVRLDLEEGTTANLGTSTTLVSRDTSEIAEGSYALVAFELTDLELQVDAIAHVGGGVSYPGVFGMDLALADGPDRDQGEYQAEVTVYGTTVSQDADLDVRAVPQATPCVVVDHSGGNFRVVMKAREPIEVSWSEPASAKLSLTAFSEAAFGWRDQDSTDFQNGAFDVGFPPITEVPEFAFLRGYTLSVDGNACEP